MTKKIYRGEALLRRDLSRDLKMTITIGVAISFILFISLIYKTGGFSWPVFLMPIYLFLLMHALYYWWAWYLFLFRTKRLKEFEIDGSEIKIAHLSDLHLTDSVTMEEGLPKDSVIENARQAIRWAVSKSDLVFVTGDITDSGRASEWGLFQDIRAGLNLEDDRKIIFIPGNHDLSIIDEKDNQWSAQQSTAQSPEFERRCVRFSLGALQSAQTNWYTIKKGRKYFIHDIFNSIDDYIAQYSKSPPRLGPPEGPSVLPPHIDIVNFSQDLQDLGLKYEKNGALFPTSRNLQFSDALHEVYPMVLFENEHFYILAVNSCLVASPSFLRAAIGRVGIGQRRKLKQMLQHANGRVVVVLMHHHLGFLPRVLKLMRAESMIDQQSNRTLFEKMAGLVIRFVQTKMLALSDSGAMLRIMSRVRNSVVFHGHKHVAYSARYGRCKIISGPSVTFGNLINRNDDEHSNVAIYRLGSDGSIFTLERALFLPNRNGISSDTTTAAKNR